MLETAKQLLPRHIAIIMDGNGRWAQSRHLPRIAGHHEGFKAAKRIVKACVEMGIKVLTLFAFSTENWQRPKDEVDGILGLLVMLLRNEVKKLHENNVQLRMIGDRSRFSREIQEDMQKAELLTLHNTGLKLVIAVSYSGQWDIVQATKKIAHEIQQGKLTAESVTEKLFSEKLSLAELPVPDLFIRSSGEYRISNFLLWQLAYSEMYFSPVLWPDFDVNTLKEAIDFYLHRERRFGFTGDQIKATVNA